MLLVKVGGGWTVEKPAPAGKAEARKCDELLIHLNPLRGDSVVEYAPSSLGQYGLEKPAAAVVVEKEDGARHTVLLGDGRNQGRERYVKSPDRAPVFVIGSSLAGTITAWVETYREAAREPAAGTEAGATGSVAPLAGEQAPAAEPLVDPQARPRVTIKTSAGDVTVELFEDEAPNTVANFIQLAERGFYDGLVFHRVIRDFMIQGGCPQGTGTGDPGYRFADETKGNPHKVVRGTLCMANSGPDTNGSQFFLTTKEACPWLDGKHTVFGKVVEGMDVVMKIDGTEVGDQDRPAQEQKILKVTVGRKRREKYEVRKLDRR
jgi:cyclophilin family peptidyl-prolyl cis-trans isomerase